MLRNVSPARLRTPRLLPRIETCIVQLWLFASFSACALLTLPTHVAVTRTPPGEKTVQEEGTNLKTRQWDVAIPREGLKRGFFVAKSDLEWRALWPSTDADKVPSIPYDVDFSREMLLVSSPADADTIASSVDNVVMTDRGLHVYVTETALGVDCPSAAEQDAKNYYFARVQRVDDKEMSFHVATAFGDPCGKAPEAVVACKPIAGAAAPEEKLSVAPETTVSCTAASLTSSRPIFDLTWTWDQSPPGSTAKIDVTKGGHGATFVPDVIGLYRISLETSDDLQRKGSATADISVLPPSGPLSLQMAWSKFDAGDDPSTFPRVALHAFGAWSAPARPIGWGRVKDCSTDAAAPGCTAKAAGPTTLMTLDPKSGKEFAVGVHYTDERVDGQPVLCVRAYRDGKMQTEVCDTQPHKEDTWWDVAVIDAATGKTPEVLAAERAAATAHKAAPAASPPAAAGGKGGSAASGGAAVP